MFSSVIFTSSTQQQWTSSQLDCDVWQKGDFIWQPAITSSVVTLRSSQTLSKAKFRPPKMSWSLSAGLLLVWSTTGFWIPVKPLHLRSRLSKSMRCTKNCSAYSQHWSTERAHFFSLTRPNCISHNQCVKMCTNWAKKFCLIHHIHLTSHQLTATFSSISTTFCKENASTTKNAFQEFVKSQSKDFYIAEVNKQFSLTRRYWL